MIGALSYGELAAMMPKAGGQYVYLRESLGPLWGFLFGWTLFLVIQTGTIAAVCVAFGKFLGVFFPSVSTTHWLWHIAHVPAWRVGPMVLGNMEIGVSTANLAGIVIVVLLAIVNIFGVGLGALIQNIFTSAKAIALGALILLAFTIGRTAEAWQANFANGAFWKNAGWSAMHPVQVGVGGPMVLVNLVVILAVVQVGSLFSADAWNNITFTAGEVKNPKRNLPLTSDSGNRVCADGLLSGIARVPAGAAAARRCERGDGGGAGDSVRGRGPRGDGSAGADLPHRRGVADGWGDSDFDVRLRKRDDAGGGAGVLRDEQGRAVLQVGGQAASEVQDAGGGVVDPGGLDGVAVRVRFVRSVAGLHHLRGAGVLHSDHRRVCLCCGSSSRMRRGLTRHGATRCCRRSTS